MCRDGNQLAGIPKNASLFTKIVFKNLYQFLWIFGVSFLIVGEKISVGMLIN